MTTQIAVNIVYPTDPFAPIPGGTDTCIRDVLAYAPDDIVVGLVGVTADPVARPVGAWTTGTLGGRQVAIYPVLEVEDLRQQQRIPLSARFTAALFRAAPRGSPAILQFHRIEPMLAYWRSACPKVLFVHQNMNVIRNRHSDIRWRYAPFAYEWLERRCIAQVDHLFCVREDAVREYRRRYPDKAGQMDFLPTWMDPATFSPVSSADKPARRAQLLAANGLSWSAADDLCVFVGRLDHQKNPLLLVRAFALARLTRPSLRLVIIGDGILRANVEAALAESGLCDSVRLLGVRSREQVAEFLRCADVKLLSSAYEGMPRCVVEALGSGIPAVATAVGEVPRLVQTGVNGIVVDAQTPEAFAAGVLECFAVLPSLTVERCVAAVTEFTPNTVLGAVYDAYRRIGGARAAA